MNPTTTSDSHIGSNNDDEYYQISDDDVDDFEDLGDECLLEEVESGGSLSGNNAPLSINNVRGPYERAWTTDATRALIHIRGPLEGRFTEGRQKRTALWLHCTRQLQRLGHRYSAAKVQKKWHNILITYNKNLSKKYSTGYVHWEFFEEMFKYLQGKKADCEQALLPLAPPPPLTPRQQPKPEINNEKPLQNQTGGINVAQFNSVSPEKLQLQTLPVVQTDKKSNDEYDDDDDDSTTLSELKKPKLELSPTYPIEFAQSNGVDFGAQNTIEPPLDQETNLQEPRMMDWWQDYFERKLQVEREKIQAQREIHNDLMQFKKVSLAQQERIERIKIDAINSLTSTLQKLTDIRNRKS